MIAWRSTLPRFLGERVHYASPIRMHSTCRRWAVRSRLPRCRINRLQRHYAGRSRTVG